MIPLPDNCTVRLIDLPAHVGGRISQGPDGHIDIYVNARLSSADQRAVIRHEWRHWINGDLDGDRDIRQVEREADGPERSRRLPPLLRARDLPAPSPRPRQASMPQTPTRPAASAEPTGQTARNAASRPSLPSEREWADDILFRLPLHD